MNVQEIALNTFTISALLMTASIVLLNYTWKKLKEMLNTMPPDKRRVKFNLRSVSEHYEHFKYEYISAQFIACVFLALSLLGALIAVSVMSGIMIGDTTGTYTEDNFKLAIVAMRTGVYSLCVGLLLLAIVYFEELIALYKGEASIITSKLENLPKQPLDIVRFNIFAILPGISVIIIGLIEIFCPYDQWVKMTIAILALIILTLIVHYGYRTYRRIRMAQRGNKITNATDKMNTAPDWTTLKGKFFHAFNDEGYVKYQGLIVDLVDEDIAIVLYFSAFTGTPTYHKAVWVSDIVDQGWALYPTDEAWRDAIDIGLVKLPPMKS